MNAKAARDFEGFWARLARETLTLEKAVHQGARRDAARRSTRWFDDGELNVSYNCLDRNLENGNADKVAIIFEADDGTVTQRHLPRAARRVCRLANGCRSLGVAKGDRVVIYMPMSIEGIVAMQACARIGATHSVVFGGFSAKSLQERIVDVGRRRGHHRRRADARRQGAAAEGHRRRGARHGRLRQPCAMSSSIGAPAATSRCDRARDVWMHELTANAAGHLRARMGRRRASALHPLHVGIDRQAEGRAAHHRRLSAVVPR